MVLQKTNLRAVCASQRLWTFVFMLAAVFHSPLLLALLTLLAGAHGAFAFSSCRSCETEEFMRMSNMFSRRTSGLAPAQ